MKRRTALAALATTLVWPAVALPQVQGRMPVVGLLITHPPVNDLVVDLLRTGLREYGYEERKNIRIEVRSALGKLERVPGLAQELVEVPVDVIVVVNEIAVRAVTQATRTIPIVLVGYTSDPVAMGWVESYRRPGGNLTGVFAVDIALAAKRLEVLKETLPGLARVVMFWDPSFSRRELEETQHAARSLGVELSAIEVRRAEDLITALQAAKQRKAGALILGWSPVFWVSRHQVGALYREAGLPAITAMTHLAEAGVLLSYGSDNVYNWVRAASFVDRLLKGARAAELPVEQASRIKLVVNLKTAKSLGIIIPQSILLRADEVIQ
jgi:putative ABC transport system substrate-binding protein